MSLLMLNYILHFQHQALQVDEFSLEKLILCYAVQVTHNLGGHHLSHIAEVLVSSLPRKAVTECLHTNTGIGISLPSKCGVRLNDHSRNAIVSLQHGSSILYWLCLEQSLAREADDPCSYPLP